MDDPDKPIVWRLENEKRPDLAEQYSVANFAIGRDDEDEEYERDLLEVHTFGLTDQRISRRQCEVSILDGKLTIKNIGRNNFRLIEAAAGKSKKIKAGSGIAYELDDGDVLDFFKKPRGNDSEPSTPTGARIRITRVKSAASVPLAGDKKGGSKRGFGIRRLTTVENNNGNLSSGDDADTPKQQKKRSLSTSSDSNKKDENGGTTGGGLAPLSRTSSSQWVIHTSPRSGGGSPGAGSPRQQLWTSTSAKRGFSWTGELPAEGQLAVSTSPTNAQQAHSDSEDNLGNIKPGSRSNSPLYGISGAGTIRTADAFPFQKNVAVPSLVKQGSSSSILSSDKHNISPRSIRRNRNSVDQSSAPVALQQQNQQSPQEGQQHLNQDEEKPGLAMRGRRSSLLRADDKTDGGSKGGGRRDSMGPGSPVSQEAGDDLPSIVIAPPPVVASTDAAPGVPAPRVGSDYQVELPAVLSQSQVRPIDTIRQAGKGSIAAWTKAMGAEPEPLDEDADIRADRTGDWSEQDKLLFHRSFFDYNKDFVQMYRNFPEFQQSGKTPQDLIAYYYRRYKSTADYRRWKNHAGNDGDGQRKNEEQPLTFLSLKDLIDMQVVSPGPNKLSMWWQHSKSVASLRHDGLIVFGDMEFEALHDFSLYVKRLSSPDMDPSEDNAWLSVTYGGRTLAEIREEAAERRYPAVSSVDQFRTAAADSLTAASGGSETNKPATRKRRGSTIASAFLGPAAGLGDSIVENVHGDSGGAPSSLPAWFMLSVRSNAVKSATRAARDAAAAHPGKGSISAIVSKNPWKVRAEASRLSAGAAARRSAPSRVRTLLQPSNSAAAALLAQVAPHESRHMDLDIQSSSDEDDSRSEADVDAQSTGTAPTAPRRGKKRSAVTMATLVEDGYLEPGQGVLRLKYRDRLFWGDLLPTGEIQDQTTRITYPSGNPGVWSCAVKKRLNPSLKNDAGWPVVHYVPLTHKEHPNNNPESASSSSTSASNEMEIEDDSRSTASSTINPGPNSDEKLKPLAVYRKWAQTGRPSDSVKAAMAKAKAEAEAKAATEAVASKPPANEFDPSEVEMVDADAQSKVKSEPAAPDSAQPATSEEARRSWMHSESLPGPLPKLSEDEIKLCICQVSKSAAAAARAQDPDVFFLRCSKATGACNGWVHPPCLGLALSLQDADELVDFVCPLCSGDGLELKPIIERGAREPDSYKEVERHYSPGTLIMSRIDFPRDHPVGWFSAKIVEADHVHHKDKPYRIVYGFNPGISEWISLGPNDPTKMIAADWVQSECYQDQDTRWRNSSRASLQTPSARRAVASSVPGEISMFVEKKRKLVV